jgi:hypothetical protein
MRDYGESPAILAGSLTAAGAISQNKHLNPDGFMGLHWPSIIAAVVVGSLTAVMTQLVVTHVKAVRETQQREGGPKQTALSLSLPVENL